METPYLEVNEYKGLLGSEVWQGAAGQRILLCFNSKDGTIRQAAGHTIELVVPAVPGGSFHMTDSFHKDTRHSLPIEEDVFVA